jgi:hypothetical protein
LKPGVTAMAFAVIYHIQFSRRKSGFQPV